MSVTNEDLHGLIAALVGVLATCVTVVAVLRWWSPCLENCEDHASFQHGGELLLALVALAAASTYVLATFLAHRLRVPLLAATLACYVAWFALVAT